MSWFLLMLLGFILSASVLLNIVFLLKYVWTQPSRARSFAVNGCIMGFTLFYLLFALEIGFYTFAVQSDAFVFTLASKRWQQKYWTPVNKQGFRDRDHTAEDLAGKKVLFVTGDSFVAGMGINDYKDRFPDVLQTRLGSDWQVINLGKNGWGTAQEYKAVTSYPYPPDVVVLSYYINDIDAVAQQNGCLRPILFTPPRRLLKPFIDRSYFINYVYWRLYRFSSAHMTERYWEFIQECQSNEQVWEAHERELLDLVAYTREHNIQLMVVTFPHLVLIDESTPLIAKVVALMESHGVPVIDMTPALKGRPPQELVVNPYDSHPNEAVHAEVAGFLYDAIQARYP